MSYDQVTAQVIAEIRDKDATIARLTAERDIYRAERDHARACLDRGVQILTGIHSLLSPALVEANGKTYIFRSPHIHEQLQVLSDRVRALPDELDAIDSARKAPATPTGSAT